MGSLQASKRAACRALAFAPILVGERVGCNGSGLGLGASGGESGGGVVWGWCDVVWCGVGWGGVGWGLEKMRYE